MLVFIQCLTSSCCVLLIDSTEPSQHLLRFLDVCQRFAVRCARFLVCTMPAAILYVFSLVTTSVACVKFDSQVGSFQVQFVLGGVCLNAFMC